MTDWFRSWHGAPTDPKWLGIAKRAGVAPGIAVAVAWALMDRASQASERGSIEGHDAEGLAYFFGCEPEQVEAIVAAMTDKGMIVDGRFTAWEKRQPVREDDSSQRVKAFRERKKTQGNAPVTQRNAPDTETETDTEAGKNNKKRARALDGFAEWYALYPNKVQRGAAERAWPKARANASLAELVDGLARYIASKPPDRAWQNPATWLNGKGWLDQPATPTGQGPPAKAPQMADVFKFIGTHGHEPEPADDSSSVRPAIPHLSAVGSGR